MVLCEEWIEMKEDSKLRRKKHRLCVRWERNKWRFTERAKENLMESVMLVVAVQRVVLMVNRKLEGVDGMLFSFCVCIFLFYSRSCPPACSQPRAKLLEISTGFLLLFSPLQNENFLEGKCVSWTKHDMLAFPFLMQDLHFYFCESSRLFLDRFDRNFLALLCSFLQHCSMDDAEFGAAYSMDGFEARFGLF